MPGTFGIEKSSLQPRSAKVYCFVFWLHWWQLLGHVTGTLLVPLKRCRHQKVKIFWGPRFATGGIFYRLGSLALQVCRVFSNREPRAIRKTTMSHACPWLWVPGHPKGSPSNWTVHLHQQPDKRKNTGSLTVAVWAQPTRISIQTIVRS